MNDLKKFYGVFKEQEAFDYAASYYNVLSQGNPFWNKSLDIIGETAEHYFRTSLELQVSGLCLIAGKPRNEILLPVSFAFFVVDHLTMGWCALMASHFRVAYSMSRGAVEGSIFELASATKPDTFTDLWNSKRGTGGTVLRSLKESIPKESYDILDRGWKLTVSFGHASFSPVSSSAQIVKGDKQKRIGIMTFGGPNGPLNESAILELGIAFGTASLVGLEAMHKCEFREIQNSDRWITRYEQIMKETKEVAERALKKLRKWEMAQHLNSADPKNRAAD